MITVTNDFKTEVKGDAKQLTAYARKDRTLNNGTLTNFLRKNGTPTAIVITDGALVFNGSTSVIDVGDSTHSAVKSIFFRILATDATSQALFDLDAGTTTITTDGSDDIVAGGFTTPTIYVNGAVATRILDATWASVCITTATGIDVDNLDIGKIAAAFFGGRLDDIQFYTETLTAAEVLAQHNAGRGQYALKGLGLVLQYSGRDFAGTEATPTTIYDTNMIVDGKFDEAVSFDGVDDYISADSKITGYPFILGALFKTGDNIGSRQTIVSLNKSDAANVYYSIDIEGGKTSIVARNTTATAFAGNTTLSTNTWYQVIGFFESPTSRYLYLNGVLDSDVDDRSVTFNAGTDSALFGNLRLTTPTQFWGGAISHPLIINRALSQEEITALYETQKNYEFEAGIPDNVLYLPLDAKNINHATDKATDLNIADLSYANNLKSVKLIQETDISSTMIRQIELTSWGADMLGGEYKVGIGVYIGGDVEYIEYGTFKIQKIEQRKGMEQVVATGYDKMYEALRRYDLSTPYPATVKEYVEAICTKLGWELGTSSFFNDDLVLEADLYSFQNFTFRDILDQIAEVTCSVIRFGIDDKLYIQELKTVVDEAVTTSELRTLDIENKWGAINSVVFTENPVERNFVYEGGYYNPPILLENGEELLLENGEPYLSNRLVEIDDLWQIRYTNNLILGEDREGLIGDIATELTGKEFYPFTAKTIGLGYFEVGDLITLEDLQGTEYQTYIMSVTVELSGSGFKDSLGMVEPRKSRSNYKKEAGVITKELIDSQLGESNIEDGAVSTAKIRDASITTAKIEDASITTAKIENLSADKITTGTLNVNTKITVNDGTHDRVIIGKIS